MGSSQKQRPNIVVARPSRRRRDRRRQAGGNWEFVAASSAPVGPEIVTASFDELVAAVQGLPPKLDWKTVRDAVIPLFPRIRQYPPGFPSPLQVMVAPGLSVGFGVDIGPAFMPVSHEMLNGWRLSVDDLTRTALGNLRTRAASVRERDIVRERVAGELVALLQSPAGCASTYVLVPDELARLFGLAAQVLVAPMRNLLISLPVTADRRLLADLFDMFASQDPNRLAPIVFRFADGRVTLDEILPPVDEPSTSAEPDAGRLLN